MRTTLSNNRSALILSLIIFFVGINGLQAQFIINEIESSGTVEIKNEGSSTMDISSYWLCNFPSYSQLSSLTVECGSLNLAPGDLVVVSGFTYNSFDGELGLYTSSSFSSPNDMLDYVEWGSTGHTRSSVAVMAGIWSTGDFVPSFMGSASLEYDGNGDDGDDWVAVDVNSLCAENPSAACDAVGGNLTTNDPTEICAGDGIADPIDVDLSGISGSNSAWVITDADGVILDLPFGPPFDLEGAGSGICLIWHLSHEDDLMGAEVGNNASDLTGCFDLSNPITVTRTGVDGGTISTDDNTDVCAGDGIDDIINVSLTDSEGANSAWVITDADGNILDLPAGPPFDFEGAGEGVCLIWHLSFEDGLTGAEVGNNASDLEGCFDLSNPITVTRTEVAGGTITTNDPTEICAGDGVADPIDVALSGNEGTNSAWVITDADGNILDLPTGPPFDLEGAGGGVCLIWHLSFEDGLEGAEVGNNASDLEGCFDLSNPITVTRTGVNGGVISTDDPTTVCTLDGSDDFIDVTVTDAEGSNSAWVITDTDGNILDLPLAPPFNFEGAGVGICLIWHLSFEDGLTGAMIGNNASDLMGCFDLSDPIVVNRFTGDTDGGMITTDDPTEICAGDGFPDPIDVELMGNVGTNSAWVITDADGNILDLPAGPPFDLEGAGGGVCLIWHLSYENGITGAQVGNNASDIQGCFSLSNPITVTRTGVEGGTITTNDPTEFCVGDGVEDLIDVVVSGNEGANSAWVITDLGGMILDLPAAPPFDFEGAGDGTCIIWHLSFEDGLEGAVVGNNATDLVGCFDLSNPIEVTRIGVEGGVISTDDPTNACVGDGIPDIINVDLTGNVGSNSAWVITDADGNILELPSGPSFDFEGAPIGTCLIWHLSFEDGLEGAEVGNNAADLMGCFSLSNPITVVRNNPFGGDITTTDPTDICAGDGIPDPIDVVLTNNVGPNSLWLITDVDGNILDLPAGPPFDLEGAGEGICLIWHVSYADVLEGAEVGNNAADLMGCQSFSNAIFVNRTGVDGGEVTTASGEEMVTVCVGDGVADVINFATTSDDMEYQYVITDDNNIILDLPVDASADFEGAETGTCRVWGLSYTGNLLAGPGDDAAAIALSDECYVLSATFITVNRVDSGEECVTSTAEATTLSANLLLSPNPVDDLLQLDIEFLDRPEGDVQVLIQDITGKVLYTQPLNSNVLQQEQIDVSAFPAGVYVLSVRDAKRIRSERFIVR